MKEIKSQHQKWRTGAFFDLYRQKKGKKDQKTTIFHIGQNSLPQIQNQIRRWFPTKKYPNFIIL